MDQSLNGRDVHVVGFYDVGQEDVQDITPERMVAGPLVDVALKHRVDEIIVAVDQAPGLRLSELLDCKLAGIRVLDLTAYFERAIGQIHIDSIQASWLIFGDGFRHGILGTVVKRVFDITGALALLVLASPVMLAIALLVMLGSGHRILHRQQRVGLGGRTFELNKFCAVRAESKCLRIADAFIRKYRLDGLPELFSVLKGHMSLVGPRAEPPGIVDQWSRSIAFYAVRHSIKPGVTGWAQVRYPFGGTLGDATERLHFDLYYLKNHTLFLDLVILFETVVMTFEGELSVAGDSEAATQRHPIKTVPGSLLLRIAEFFYSAKTYERVFEPIVADLWKEYSEALAQNRQVKAGWVRVRGTWSFLCAALSMLPGELIRFLIKLLKG